MNNNSEIEKNSVELLSEAFHKINIDCPAELVAKWAQSTMTTEDEIHKVEKLLFMVRSEMDKHRMLMLTTMSRIPQISRKTFDNFHTDRLSKENEEMIRHLKSLDFITLGENIVIAGDPGTGKTHLAQAIGNLCCEKMITVRYFKFSELIGKLSKESSRVGIEKMLVSLSS